MNDFIQILSERIKGDLPGYTAHHPMMGYRRAQPQEARQMNPPALESAVMMLLYQKGSEWYTAFMKRPDGDSTHSGQISFPGGKQEPNETHEQTALRETFEEIGIAPDSVNVIGELSELYIPPSHFIVRPYIGLLDYVPVFVPNPSEVIRVIEEPVANFLKEEIILQKEIYISKYNARFNAMYFDLQGETLWGATAMVVQEFRSILGFNT